MREAKTIRRGGSGDGLGAKLVWSPLSDLLLYGQTALVYQALNADVLVSLGTDWSPSGSRNVLDELKIADIALRDARLLGADRDLVEACRITGKTSDEVRLAEKSLDRKLVEMVTTNPARTLHWEHEVGSVGVGKTADLLVITKPTHKSAEELPDSPYRSLIDATEKDVALVIVNGEPLTGDVGLMEKLKPGDYETLTSARGGFEKAIDVTRAGVFKGGQTLAQIEATLREALASLGGGASSLGALPSRMSLEPIQLTPVLIEDDDFYFDVLERNCWRATSLIADPSPPFARYRANFNQVQPRGNPFSAERYRNRYYRLEEPVPSPSLRKVPLPQPQPRVLPLPGPVRSNKR